MNRHCYVPSSVKVSRQPSGAPVLNTRSTESRLRAAAAGRRSIKAPERNRSLSRLLRWVSACSHPSMPRAPVVPPPQGSTAGVRLATVRAIAVQPPSHNSTRVSLTPSGASVLDTRSTESRLRYLSFAMSRLRPPALGERRHCVCACRAIARLNPRSGWL